MGNFIPFLRRVGYIAATVLIAFLVSYLIFTWSRLL